MEESKNGELLEQAPSGGTIIIDPCKKKSKTRHEFEGANSGANLLAAHKGGVEKIAHGTASRGADAFRITTHVTVETTRKGARKCQNSMAVWFYGKGTISTGHLERYRQGSTEMEGGNGIALGKAMEGKGVHYK